MKNRILLSLFITIFTTVISAQSLTVADSILSEIQTKTIVDSNKEDTLVFKIAYPTNYDSTKTYPVLLGLSGGNQNEAIVNYCYAAWFRSDYFHNHITIMPVNSKGKNLLHYTQEEIVNVLNAIKNNFQTTANNWIIVGTSNGGRATFNFIAQEPALFEGGILIPGSIGKTVEINKDWSHMKFVLAYGEKDSEGWIKGTEYTKEVLTKYTPKIETIVLKGQGHILPIEYNLDFVYQQYFQIK